MKGKFLFAALASVVFASCVNDEQVVEVPKGNEIRLTVATQTASSRAEHDKDYVYKDKLYIWAWAENSDAPIINGEEFDASTGAFANGKIYYYPVDGSEVEFLAIPKNVKDLEYFDEPVRENKAITYTFNVGHTNHSATEHEVDLMTSEVVRQSQGVVAIVLRHLTTKLNVIIQQKQKNNDATTAVVSLKKVQIQNIKNHGHVTLDEAWKAVNGSEDCYWDSISVAAENICTWTVYETASGADDYQLATHASTDAKNDFKTTEPHYVVPQQLISGGQKLYLEYEVETKYINEVQPDVIETFCKTIDLNGIADVNWAMNKNVTYLIGINPIEDSHKITFEVYVEEWGLTNGEATIKPGDSENI